MRMMCRPFCVPALCSLLLLILQLAHCVDAGAAHLAVDHNMTEHIRWFPRVSSQDTENSWPTFVMLVLIIWLLITTQRLLNTLFLLLLLLLLLLWQVAGLRW
jgi:hypothetical protein